MTNNFLLIRHHVQPRRALFHPLESDANFPVPVGIVGVMRLNRTNVEDEAQSVIHDVWYVTAADVQSDCLPPVNLNGDWTGATTFYFVRPTPPPGETWAGNRLVKKRKGTIRPDDIWPESWSQDMTPPAHEKSLEHCRREKPLRYVARDHRKIWYLEPMNCAKNARALLQPELEGSAQVASMLTIPFPVDVSDDRVVTEWHMADIDLFVPERPPNAGLMATAEVESQSAAAAVQAQPEDIAQALLGHQKIEQLESAKGPSMVVDDLFSIFEHLDHVQPADFTSLMWFGLPHEQIDIQKAMKIPSRRKSLLHEWEKLTKTCTWPENEVFKEVLAGVCKRTQDRVPCWKCHGIVFFEAC